MSSPVEGSKKPAESEAQRMPEPLNSEGRKPEAGILQGAPDKARDLLQGTEGGMRAAEKISLNQVRILVVEDEPGLQRMIPAVLTCTLGVAPGQIVVATDAADGVAKLLELAEKQCLPDLIILDFRGVARPFLDGVAQATAGRENPLQHTAIVIASGDATDKEVEDLGTPQIKKRLDKPFRSLDGLQEALVQVLVESGRIVRPE